MKIFPLFLISSFLLSFSRAEATGSVFFIDSSTHQFLRTKSTNYVAQQSESMLLSEVGATISVLLGFAPPDTLSAAGSSKLNEVLIPNPFNRPRAVFMLEVSGVDDPLVVDPKNGLFSNALKNNVDLGSSQADIELPDEEEVSVISLDDPLGDYTEEDINDFASWLGGSYVTDATKPLNGVLTIPLANGDNVNLHMSKKVHRECALKLFALSHNIRKALKREDFSRTLQRPAELIMGSFDGIKALQEQHDSDSFDKQGMRLLLATLSKIFDSLQTAHEGQIVGVIVFNEVPQPESKTLMNVMFTSRPSPRWLEETKGSLNTTLAAQVLVRRTLAWITGVVLVIATLMGVYFLLNMPLTRDTLLYSNVKLD